MPYDQTLQNYLLPEFFMEPPREWEARLREISPKHERLAHLRFRFREPQESWVEPHGVWELYACTPRHMMTEERAEQFIRHWSEMPTKGQQVARRAVVSNYQHFMWHQFGVEARRFWVLQGTWGGTPAVLTPREVRYLDACGALSEPFPLGMFPPCAFDERAVRAIQQRDRLIEYGNNLDKLEASDTPEAIAAEADIAEVTFREKYLDTLYEMMAPAAEFMKSQRAKKEMDGLDLPPAPDGVGSDTWKDVWRETGAIPNAGRPSSRSIMVAVA